MNGFRGKGRSIPCKTMSTVCPDLGFHCTDEKLKWSKVMVSQRAGRSNCKYFFGGIHQYPDLIGVPQINPNKCEPIIQKS